MYTIHTTRVLPVGIAWACTRYHGYYGTREGDQTACRYTYPSPRLPFSRQTRCGNATKAAATAAVIRKLKLFNCHAAFVIRVVCDATILPQKG